MFVNRLPKFPEIGDPQTRAALIRYFNDLQKPGALAIQRPQYWTPTLTFATPGDLSVTYTHRLGVVIQTERELRINFRILTSAFTHTTASGNCQITGLPYISNGDANYIEDGTLVWGGIDKTNYTQVSCGIVAGSSVIQLPACGMAQAASNVAAADMPTGGTIVLRGNLCIRF